MSACLITGNVHHGSLVKVVSARFLHYKITIYHFVNYEMFWGRYFNSMQYPVFLKFLFINFSVHWQMITGVFIVFQWWFSLFLYSFYINWDSSQLIWKPCPFFPFYLFIQSYICNSMHSWIFILFFVLSLFVAQIFAAFGIGSSYRLAPVPFDTVEFFCLFTTS